MFGFGFFVFVFVFILIKCQQQQKVPDTNKKYTPKKNPTTNNLKREFVKRFYFS